MYVQHCHQRLNIRTRWDCNLPGRFPDFDDWLMVQALHHHNLFPVHVSDPRRGEIVPTTSKRKHSTNGINIAWGNEVVVRNPAITPVWTEQDQLRQEEDDYLQGEIEKEWAELEQLDELARKGRVMVRFSDQKVINLDTGEEIKIMSPALREAVEQARAKINRTIELNFARNRKQGEKVEGIVEENLQDDPEKLRWLWYGYIPAGKITIVAGDPGMGKSTIALDIVSRVTRGTFMPLSSLRTQRGFCGIVTAEDAPEDTIIPRVMANGADRTRVRSFRKVIIEGEEHFFSFPRDLLRLRNYIIKRRARLIVIDPLSAFVEKGTDTYKDQDIRLVLGPLEALAEETDCAILIVAHLNKKEEASILYRIGGSIGFIAAARSVLAVRRLNRDDENENPECVLYSLKSSVSRKPPSLVYHIETKIIQGDIESSEIYWDRTMQFDPNRRTDMNEGKQDCLEFCKQELSDAEVESTQVYTDAKQAGISKRTLDRYKPEFKISSRKKNGKWYWSAPEKWPE